MKLVAKDRSSPVLAAIKTLTQTKVLVGVPADKAPRDPDDAHGAPRDVNNAALAYIHDRGAPEVGIPARPFMRPGIADALDKIEVSLKEAGRAALAGQTDRMNQAFTKTGLVAQSSIQAKITDGPFVPLKPATIERKGSDTPLIDTGQLRRAINFVVKKPGQS